MGKKEFVKEALDWDQGIVTTFLTLFSAPEKVVNNPQAFTRPWKYATYVVSVSCVFTWFLIHSFVETQDPSSFWLTPRRMLELLDGYQNFYENTQPLKRLILGAIAFYMSLTIFLFAKRKSMPGFLAISLYLIGHSVFIMFVLQSIGVMIIGRWNSNVVTLIAIVTQATYLTYAIIRILGKLKWTTILFKGVGIFVIQFTLYNASATRFVHGAYYGILHHRDMIFQAPHVSTAQYEEEVISGPIEKEAVPADPFVKEVRVDSLTIVSECSHPSPQEVARITLRCFSKTNLHWSVVLFEKINRYSPDPADVLIRVDTTLRRVFAVYRIANDSNATVHVAAVDVATGKMVSTTSVSLSADDVHVYDVAVDSSFLYLGGSAQYKRDNFDLALLVKLDKQSGRVVKVNQMGSTSFASWTSIQHVNVMPGQLQCVVKRDFKWMFLINKTQWSTWKVEKRNL